MGKYSNHLITFTSVWEDKVSCFASIKTIEPMQISLRQWIENCIQPKSEKALNAKSMALQYRSTGDKSIKMNMPVISPGALLKTRAKDVPLPNKIQKLTGWMQFDIDPKDNPNIQHGPSLRDQVKNIVYVAYCSVSVSGSGVWGLVRVSNPERYREHFEQLKLDFAALGIKLDGSKGGNPTDLRIYSYDVNAYIAKEFQIYYRLFKRIPHPLRLTRSNNSNDILAQTEQLISEIQTRNIELAPDYQTYFRLGFAFANQFGEPGRIFFHSVCSMSAVYKEQEADKQYSKCLMSGNKSINIATFFFLCKKAGINIKKNKL